MNSGWTISEDVIGDIFEISGVTEKIQTFNKLFVTKKDTIIERILSKLIDEIYITEDPKRPG